MNKKEFFIKNPARAIRAQMQHEAYVPEWQRLMAEGKLAGVSNSVDLPEQQAVLRNQIIKDLKMSPKVTVPSVGQQDIGWNKQATFYDEPLVNKPIYDDNLIREDLTSEELDSIYERLSKDKIDHSEVQHANKKYENNSFKENDKYTPPSSLDQLSSNEIVIIAEGQVIFSSLEESEIKNKLSELIFEENYNPEKILVIKRMPISISINLS